MPIYEYACQECGRKTSAFHKVIPAEEPTAPACAFCGSAKTEKAINKVAYHAAERSRGAPMADPNVGGWQGYDYWRDPSNIGRWAEQKLDEAGLEMPRSAGEMIEKARSGKVDEILEKRGLDFD